MKIIVETEERIERIYELELDEEAAAEYATDPDGYLRAIGTHNAMLSDFGVSTEIDIDYSGEEVSDVFAVPDDLVSAGVDTKLQD